MNRHLYLLWAPLLALGLWVVHAPAQSPAPVETASATEDISPERLGEMLKGLGYTVEPVRNGEGRLIGVEARWPLWDGEFTLMLKAC